MLLIVYHTKHFLYWFVNDDNCDDWLGYNLYQAALDNSVISFNGQIDIIANCPTSYGLCTPKVKLVTKCW